MKEKIRVRQSKQTRASTHTILGNFRFDFHHAYDFFSCFHLYCLCAARAVVVESVIEHILKRRTEEEEKS